MEPVLAADFVACFTGVLADFVEDLLSSGAEAFPGRARGFVGVRPA